MVIKGLSRVPISLSEMGISKIARDQYWLVPDSVAIRSSPALSRAQFKRQLALNPDITLKPNESVIFRTLNQVFNVSILIIDTATGDHYLSQSGVVVVENINPNIVKVSNITSPANTITIHVEPIGV